MSTGVRRNFQFSASHLVKGVRSNFSGRLGSLWSPFINILFPLKMAKKCQYGNLGYRYFRKEEEEEDSINLLMSFGGRIFELHNIKINLELLEWFEKISSRMELQHHSWESFGSSRIKTYFPTVNNHGYMYRYFLWLRISNYFSKIKYELQLGELEPSERSTHRNI